MLMVVDSCQVNRKQHPPGTFVQKKADGFHSLGSSSTKQRR
jgi:hypothetical protein